MLTNYVGNAATLISNYSEISFCVFSDKYELIHCSYLETDLNKITILSHIRDVEYGLVCPKIIVYNGIELYGLIDHTYKDKKYRFLVGPVLTIRPMAEVNLSLLSFTELFGLDRTRKIIRQITMMTINKFIQYLLAFSYVVTDIKYKYEDLDNNRLVIENAPIFNREPWTNDKASLQSVGSHWAMEEIESIMSHVRLGALEPLKEHLEKSTLHQQLFDTIARDNLEKFVAAATLLARTVMEAKIPHDDAIAISITFVKYAENIDNPVELGTLFKTMITSFATRVNEENNRKQFPESIKKALNYIENHLHYPITLEDIAKHVNLSRSYLSQLFATKTGMPLQKHVKAAKIRASEELLKYTQRSVNEISDTLAFCSQSYFTEVFKEINGITPVAYRKQHH
ncbi:MAG: helix-turn-helix transcriptional regulator [Bacilli bacterium]|nr:helix-turn-helix transcriptional regulator [Bacilli bacterium]